MKKLISMILIFFVSILFFSKKDFSHIYSHFKNFFIDDTFLSKPSLKSGFYYAETVDVNHLMDFPDRLKSNHSVSMVDDFKNLNPDLDDENENYDSLISQRSLNVMDQIIKQVEVELDNDVYGEAGSESYVIVYLFSQSLKAYRHFLANPTQGPEFRILYDQDFSGRYHYHQGKIALGAKVLEEGESRFIVTLFHEYQHHLFHTIYGTPKNNDIVRKFYNELSAYIFEFLLANYLPYEAFEPHRGHLPRLTQNYLKEGEIEKIYKIILEMMLPNELRSKPIYSFLNPIVENIVDPQELIDGINEDFHPDEDLAYDLSLRIDDYKN